MLKLVAVTVAGGLVAFTPISAKAADEPDKAAVTYTLFDKVKWQSVAGFTAQGSPGTNWHQPFWTIRDFIQPFGHPEG
jgi:hypothetical protein